MLFSLPGIFVSRFFVCLTPSCPSGHRLNVALTMPAKNVHRPPPFCVIPSLPLVLAMVYVEELEFTRYNSEVQK